MTYPSMTDFHEAVQNPQIVFQDNHLKRGNIKKTPLGLPKVASGGFALTYCIEDLPNKWAVRCFHKEVPDLQERYKMISKFLRRNTSNYFVNFEYQPNGINIKSQQYPIVVMDWIEGQPLSTFIEDNLNNSRVLEIINHQILECSKTLETLGMAHGDLQQGNIMIANNQVKLIDYDGAYVPEMSFKASNEIGHVNFQHPLRGPYNFNSTIDRFSFIVIYLAIEALRVDPRLWNKYDNGQNLLFRSVDFADPDKSTLLSELERLPNFKELINNFRKLCKVSALEQIVTLNDFLNGNVETRSSELITEAQPIYYRKRQYEVFNAEDKHKIIGQLGNVVEVVGLVTDVKKHFTKRRQPMAFISFGDYKLKCFQVVIWSEGLRELRNKGIDFQELKGKWVSLTGLVEQYKNAPQIILNPGIKLNVLQNHTDAMSILSTGSFTNAVRNNKETIKELLTSPSEYKNTNGHVSTNTVINMGTRSRNQQLLYEIKKENTKQSRVLPASHQSTNTPSKRNSIYQVPKNQISQTTPAGLTSNTQHEESLSFFKKFVKGLKHIFG